jgi:hypothetical protein
MDEPQTTPEKQLLLTVLQEKIAFQKTWKRVSMVLYIIATCGTIVGSTLATILGGLGKATYAAISAAAATIFVSLEKSLLLKEKWKFHLSMLTRLENIKLELETGIIEVNDIVPRTQQILEEYARDVPISPKDYDPAMPVKRQLP